MKLTTLLIQLQAWTQEEIGAQGRLIGLLADQEKAVREGRTDGVRCSGEKLEEELVQSGPRDKRRRDLMKGFAKVFGVPAATLTLTSIMERAEEVNEDLACLRALREQLRDRVAVVVRATRRIASLARYHQGVLADLMRILTSPHQEAGALGDGVLVDAEA